MALILGDIYNQTKRIYNLNIIAGNNGLKRIMNWVYVSEDLNNADFIRGGELVITTGVSTSFTEGWLYCFIAAMIKHNTSGMIINTGKYINEKEISQNIIDMCNENNYPLFVMPWRIHIYDITRDYCNRIFYDNQTDEVIENAFAGIIKQDADYDKYVNIIKNSSFGSDNSVYRISIIDNDNVTGVSSELKFAFDNIIVDSGNSCKVLYFNNQLVLVFNDSGTDNSGLLQKIHKLVYSYTGNKRTILGTGGAAGSLLELKKSYIQALAAVKLALYNNTSFYNYDDCGIYKVLFEVNDKRVMQRYIDDKLGAIKKYDSEHKSNMSETLKAYLSHGGSIQGVADELFCHRNTINNRMHIIKQNIIERLDDPVVSCEIMMAYIMEDFINFLKNF